MKKYLEIYFLFFLKPTLMTLCFISEIMYIQYSQFANEFYFFIYLITFSIKPILYIILLIGSIFNYKIKTFQEGILTLIIVGGVYFGFPVKEISDYYQFNSPKKYFFDLGEDYFLDEYIMTHYVVNILIENIPIAIFVIINNLMLQNKFDHYIIDPIIINTAFIIINGIIISAFY